MKTIATAVLLLVGALTPSVSNAQTYPTKNVTIVVPFSAGGSNDVIARYLADALGKLWKQTVLVENRPGGGSAIGAAYVAKSPPDGYRMLFVSSSYTTLSATRTDLPFDPIKDLKPVSMVARGPVAIVTGSRVPMATLADLIRESKSRTIFYGTAGVGSTQHFNAELVNDALGIKMVPVAYPGGTESLVDLAGGRIDVVVGTLAGLLSYIKNGTAKPVAVMGEKRSPALPDTPTTTEAGFPAATTTNYWAVFLPAGTPDAIAAKINADIKTVTNSSEGREFLTKLDGEPTEVSVQEISDHVKKEIDYWTKLAKQVGITVK
jgi:tripartite-type tricarboxylate transporter receptor subunit TctC